MVAQEPLNDYSSFLVLQPLFKHILFIYFQREEKGGKKRGREMSIGYLPSQIEDLAPNQECALTGTWTCNIWFTGQCLIHWSTAAWARILILFLFIDS